MAQVSSKFIKDLAVTTAKLADDSVTAAKLAADVAGAALAQGAGGELDVQVDDVGVEISGNALQLKDGGVTEAKLDSGIDAQTFDATHTAVNYTPDQVGTEGTGKISAHLKGIDAALASAGSDELVGVSANDTTPGYLSDKITAAAEANTTNLIELKEVNDAGDEDLKIAFDESKLVHLDGTANKHDASEIDVEAADGVNHSQADLETVIGELDDALEARAKSADLASTANGLGASLIGIEDAAAQYTATTVEGALTEALDAAQAAQSDIDGHLDGGANKHDASEIDVEGTYTNLSTSDLETVIGEIDTELTGKANTALSNLASTQVNTDLIPDANNTHDLGTNANHWSKLYTNNITMDGVIRGSDDVTDSINPNSRIMYDNGGVVSVFWQNRVLEDSSSVVSLDWTNRQLVDTDGTTAKLDWSGTDIDVNSHKITNLAAPTADNDAARKIDVDTAAAGLKVKDPVDVVATSNITLSGEQTIDGVLTSTSRVLVTGQTTASENGIYVSAAGAWSRATDFDGTPNGEVAQGNIVLVLSGTDNTDTHYVLNTTNAVDPSAINVGTDEIGFTIYSRAEAITAGDGLSKTGLDLSVNVDDSTIEINADSLRVKDLGVTTAKLANDSVTSDKVDSSVAGNGVQFTDGVLSLSSQVENITLDGTDITNQNVTLAATPLANSVQVSVDGVVQSPGVDFTVSGTTLSFAGDLATSGAAELIAGDVLNIQYLSN